MNWYSSLPLLSVKPQLKPIMQSHWAEIVHTASSPTILNAAAVGVDMHAAAFLRVARLFRLAHNLPGLAKFEQAALQP